MWRATIMALVAAVLLTLLYTGVGLAHHVCPGSPITGTPGNDTITLTPGDDCWQGSEGADTVYAEGGDDLIGRTNEPSDDWGATDDPGADTYWGGPGKDVLDGKGDGSVDTINCGEGSADLASFDNGLATSPETTVVDKVNKKNCERLDWTDKDLEDCALKPWDNADVKCIEGNKRANRLLGNNDPDPRIVDVMWGKRGNDTLHARRGFDGVAGGRGQDTLFGGGGDDVLYGYQPPQTLPDKGVDRIYGGAGDDRIEADDGEVNEPDGSPDTISCGGGDHDWAAIDIGVDRDRQGVPIAQPGQAGCEFISGSDDFKRWWWFRR